MESQYAYTLMFSTISSLLMFPVALLVIWGYSSVSKIIYWVGQKGHSVFFTRCYEKLDKIFGQPNSYVFSSPTHKRDYPSDSEVKTPPVLQMTQEIRIQSLGWEDPLKEEMATHSSVLAGKIPWTEKPSGLWSMGLKESDTTEVTEHTHTHIHNTKGTFSIFCIYVSYSMCMLSIFLNQK